MPDEEPRDPLTQLAEGAAQVHELFLAYVSAGFTRPEALHLVTAMVVASTGGTQ